MAAQIDHFMYAVASLDEGIAWANDTFGVAPAYGGEHVGLGTRNALLSLGDTYLEIIAPDPAQSLDDTLGERFAALSAGGLVTWAARGNLAAVAATLDGMGQATAGPNRTERRTAEGELLVWELLFPIASVHGARMPFFIDWLACPHPGDTNPVGGRFETLRITTPDADDLARTFAALALDVPVEAGEADLSVAVATPGGTVQLTTTAETRGLALR